MNINLDIPLNPKQVEMYNRLNDDKYNECLFYGSSRSGKTFLILFWMISQSVIRKANCLISYFIADGYDPSDIACRSEIYRFSQRAE